MPLGRGIEETWEAVRERVELSGHGPTWQVTAGSFETALDYAHDRFGEVAVLARRDRLRWWPRVTLTVTNDPALSVTAPPLTQVSRPVVPPQRPAPERRRVREPDVMPVALEAIFAHQEQRDRG